jgi:WD40 repeat protein
MLEEVPMGRKMLLLVSLTAVVSSLYSQTITTDKPAIYDNSINRGIDFANLQDFVRFEISKDSIYSIDEKEQIVYELSLRLRQNVFPTHISITSRSMKDGRTLKQTDVDLRTANVDDLVHLKQAESISSSQLAIVYEVGSFNARSNKLLTIDIDRSVIIEKLKIESDHPGQLFISEGGKYCLASEKTTAANMFYVFDMNRKLVISEIRDDRKIMSFSSCSFSHDGAYLFVSNDYPTYISVWDIAQSIEVLKVYVNDLQVRFGTGIYNKPSGDYSSSHRILGYSLDSKRALVYWDKYRRVFEVDLETKRTKPIQVDSRGVRFNAAVYGDDNKILLRDDNGVLVLYDNNRDTTITTIRPFFNASYEIVGLSRRNARIATFYNNRLWIWSTNSIDSISMSYLSHIRSKMAALGKVAGENEAASVVTMKETKVMIDQLNTNLPPDQYDRVLSVIESQLVNAPKIILVEKQKRDKLLTEIEQSYTDMFDEVDRIQIGRFLMADTMLMGSLLNVDGTIVFNGKCVRIESAEVVHSFSIKKASIDELLVILPEVGEQIIEKIRN